MSNNCVCEHVFGLMIFGIRAVKCIALFKIPLYLPDIHVDVYKEKHIVVIYKTPPEETIPLQALKKVTHLKIQRSSPFGLSLHCHNQS